MSEYDLDLSRGAVGGYVFSYIQVTKDNMTEVAKWCRGACRQRDIHMIVEVPRKNGDGVMFAWPGCFVLKDQNTHEFDVRSSEPFHHWLAHHPEAKNV